MNIRGKVNITIIICFLSMASFQCHGQKNIRFYGSVNEQKFNGDIKKLPDVDITVYALEEDNWKLVQEYKTDKRGKYEIELFFDVIYKISYSKSGFVSKYVTIDCSNIPSIDQVSGFEMKTIMTIFKKISDIDFSLLDEPLGKAQYNSQYNEMAWDIDYTNDMKRKLDDILIRYYEKSDQNNY